jgi:hypothetical protein
MKLRVAVFNLLLALISLLFFVGGCAKIITHSYNQDKFLRLELKDTAPQVEPSTSTRWWFDGDDLVVEIDRWRTCFRQGERVFHRTKVTERRIPENSGQLVYLTLGAVFLPLGAANVVSPGSFVKEDSEDPEGDRKDNFNFGLAATAAGTGLLSIFIIDAIRAIDSSKEIGEVRVSAGTGQPFGCKESRGEGEIATLTIPGLSKPLEATVDDTGIVRFPLGGIKQFPTGGSARLRIGAREESIPLLMSPHFRELFNAKVGGAK